jgi:ABC-type phosphate transport system substrate-binding protein
MRVVLGMAFVLGLTFAGSASAQTPQEQPPSQTAQPDSDATGSGGSAAPIPGANSFAESQARKLIESKGYENVSALVNDSQGIWHGTATKGEAKVEVSVDYKGHVNAR